MSTPALPFPAIPPAVVPRWCVQRYPSISADCLWIAGFDGEGYPICSLQVRHCDAELFERAAEMVVQSERRKRESAVPVPRPAFLRKVD